MNEEQKRALFLETISKALDEMKRNQTIIVKRGDLFDEKERDLYKNMHEEIEDVRQFLQDGGLVNKAYRHLQMNVFMKHESFFMSLFETQHFPGLFELFEFE